MKAAVKRARVSGKGVTPYTPEDLLQLARHVRGERIDISRVSPRIRDVFAVELGLKENPGVPICYTPIFRFLSRVTAGKSVAANVRKQLSSTLFPMSGVAGLGTLKQGLTQQYSTPHFDFLYNETGDLAVRDMQVPAPRNVTLWNSAEVVGPLTSTSVPDYVQVIAVLLEYWRDRYVAAGFRDPSGTAKVLVDLTCKLPAYVLGAGGFINGRGFIALRPDLADSEMHDAPAHELFHNIEDLYHPVSHDPGELADENETSWSEGCTYMIADLYDPLVNRWMDLFNAYVRYVKARPLTNINGAASFWRYASEKCTSMNPATDKGYGADILRRCWEFAEKAGELTLPSLREAMDSVAPPNTRFCDFQFTPSGELRSNEVLYGNFLVAGITKDLADPVQDFRFDYLQDRETPGLEEMGVTQLNVSMTSLEGPTAKDLDAWSSDYYYCDTRYGPRNIQFDFALNSGGGSLLQFVLCNKAQGRIVDIVRSRESSFSRAFWVEHGPVDEIFVIVASTDTAVNYKLQAKGHSLTPDLMITTWDGVPGCEYQQDPKVQPWTGTSPDIWVEANGQKDQLNTIASDQLAKLFVRVRNKGWVANNVQVKLWYAHEGDSSWKPVRNGPDSDPNTQDQVLTIQRIMADSEYVGSVDWYLPQGPTKKIKNHVLRTRESKYQLKAEIIAGDASQDNNVACRTGVLVHENVLQRVRRPPKKTKPRKPKHPKETGKRKTGQNKKKGRTR